MKPSTAFCALIALTIGAQIISAHSSLSAPSVKEAQTEENISRPYPGMFFSTDNVVEEYEYDDAYCIVYDDPDAGMENVEICVDLETYQFIHDTVRSGSGAVGTLVLNDDYSFDGMDVYTYLTDPEFYMASESAKSM